MAYVRYVARDIVQREVRRWNIGCSGKDPPSCGEKRVRKLGRRERKEGKGGRGKREGEEERGGRGGR